MQFTYQKIRDIARKEYPNECAGFILDDLSLVPCKNLSRDPTNHFIISPLEHLHVIKKGLLATYHSHPTDPSEIHEFDWSIARELGVPSLIYSNTKNQFDILDPDSAEKPLEGRNFLYGVNDCYTLVRDWYKKIGIVLTNYKSPWGWWARYSEFENWFKKEGFIEVDSSDTRDGVVIAMKWCAEFWNHVGVIDNGMLLHHKITEKSKKDNIGGSWQRWYYKSLIHKSLS